MKWYNKSTMSTHLDELGRRLPVGDHKIRMAHHLFRWAPHLATEFNREYASIGILDLNDLVQMASEQIWIAIHNLDWEKLHEVPDDERPAVIWAYIKKSVKLKMKNYIAHVKDGVRSHRDGDPSRKITHKRIDY